MARHRLPRPFPFPPSIPPISRSPTCFRPKEMGPEWGDGERLLALIAPPQMPTAPGRLPSLPHSSAPLLYLPPFVPPIRSRSSCPGLLNPRIGPVRHDWRIEGPSDNWRGALPGRQGSTVGRGTGACQCIGKIIGLELGRDKLASIVIGIVIRTCPFTATKTLNQKAGYRACHPILCCNKKAAQEGKRAEEGVT